MTGDGLGDVTGRRILYDATMEAVRRDVERMSEGTLSRVLDEHCR